MTAAISDILIIGLVFLAALALLRLAYYRSGRVWVLRHCIVLPKKGKRAYVQGYVGEAVIATFALLSALIVRCFTPDISLSALLWRWWWIVGLALGFVFVSIHMYSRYVLLEAVRHGRRPIYCKRLRAAYSVYNFYSICIFGMGALILLMLAAQFIYDSGIFRVETSAITQTFREAREIAQGPMADNQAAYSQAIAHAEVGMGRIALANKLLQTQFNPLFMFAGTLIGINILINFTPLKHMFLGEAVTMTAGFTYGPLIIIGAFALSVYLGSYEVMLKAALDQMNLITPPSKFGDWQLSQRHAQMVTQLSDARNIFGFGRAIGGEGGGFAILAWGVQAALEKIGEKREARVKPRMPHPKFRPNA